MNVFSNDFRQSLRQFCCIPSAKELRHTLHDRRMAVVEPGIEWGGMEVCQVLPGELYQCRGEGFGMAAQPGCEPVRLPLVSAREPRAERGKRKACDGKDETEHQELCREGCPVHTEESRKT